ncbi:MAG: Nramp family divalent metal transporter [Bacteroidota bacterium]
MDQPVPQGSRSMKHHSTSTSWWRALGPGLLYAGAAVGVSHLVQSTRAGANFGLVLIWAIVLSNAIKYPFFEYGPRYAAATKKSLLDGYRNIGPWALWLFVLMTLSTMWIILASITSVTAGLAIQLTGWVLPGWQWSGLLLLACMLILGIGRYRLLDRLMKIIIITLTVTTVVAVVAALFGDVPKKEEFKTVFSLADAGHIAFLVALIGWMPAPIDIAVWHSVWSTAKIRTTGVAPSLKEALLDFKVGFWGTALLAVCFVSLGAMILYGTGETPHPKAAVFAGQLIQLYTTSIGQWATLFITVAAFTTMFSTTLTVFDAFPRILRRASQLLVPSLSQDEQHPGLYWGWIAITGLGSVGLLAYFGLAQHTPITMKGLVDLATTISFLTAPVLAYLNFRAVTNEEVPEAQRPGPFLRALSWFGLVALTGFTGYYLWITFMP